MNVDKLLEANTKLVDINKELMIDNETLIKYIKLLRGEETTLSEIDEDVLNTIYKSYEDRYYKLYRTKRP